MVTDSYSAYIIIHIHRSAWVIDELVKKTSTLLLGVLYTCACNTTRLRMLNEDDYSRANA